MEQNELDVTITMRVKTTLDFNRDVFDSIVLAGVEGAVTNLSDTETVIEASGSYRASLSGLVSYDELPSEQTDTPL